MSQPARDEHQRRVTIRERADETSAACHIAEDPQILRERQHLRLLLGCCTAHLLSLELVVLFLEHLGFQQSSV